MKLYLIVYNGLTKLRDENKSRLLLHSCSPWHKSIVAGASLWCTSHRPDINSSDCNVQATQSPLGRYHIDSNYSHARSRIFPRHQKARANRIYSREVETKHPWNCVTLFFLRCRNFSPASCLKADFRRGSAGHKRHADCASLFLAKRFKNQETVERSID